MSAARHMLCASALAALLFAAEPWLEAPEPLALDAFAGGALDRALLAREAERLGLARGDAVAQDAWARSRELLGGPGARIEPLALGVAERVPGWRHQLALRLAARIRARAAAAPVDEDSLHAWFDAERERFVLPPTVRIAQVFFAGPEGARRAVAALDRIARAALDPLRASALGDANLYGSELAPQSEAQLAARLGAPLARAAFAAPVGTWIGPVGSSHGVHLVFVRERREGRPADLAETRGAVESAWRSARGEAALAAELERLRAADQDPRG